MGLYWLPILLLKAQKSNLISSFPKRKNSCIKNTGGTLFKNKGLSYKSPTMGTD